ncbi:MAG: IS630 family transposase [Burkholderiales bacterium]|nr:IS630 family transposase [Burkholderiales bacterium]
MRRLVIDHTPDQLKMDFALWTRQAVLLLIEQRCGVRLTPQGVGLYLRRWGFTPQKPIQRAYEQQPAAVQRWLDEQYPAIEHRAKAEGAEIHWADETGLRSDDVRGRSYAPMGQTPEIRVNQRREGLSIISSVTNRGKVRFKVFEGAMNAAILIDFMKRLVQEAKKANTGKVFLVLDNLKVHHAKLVKAWLQENKEHIEVFYLPSYSPELNPDEMLNANLKAAVTSQAPNRRKGQGRSE